MRVAVLMPLRDAAEAATRFALEHNTDGMQVELLTTRGVPVERARAELWRRAAALAPAPGLIVWADGDAFWLRGTFRAAAERLAHTGERAVLASFHGKRRAYSDLNAYHLVDGTMCAVSIAHARAAPDGLTPVLFAGAHFLAHRPALFGLLGENPFALGEASAGEDYSFCKRAILAGVPVLLDARLPVFHVEGEDAYLPGRPRFRYRNGGMEATAQAPPDVPERIAERSYGPAVDALRRELS